MSWVLLPCMAALLDCFNAVSVTVTALLENFYHFSLEGSKNLTKKYHTIKSNPYIDMITFIKYFTCVYPVPVVFPFSLNPTYPTTQVNYYSLGSIPFLLKLGH